MNNQKVFILNSPDEIDEQLKVRLITNTLDELVINYSLSVDINRENFSDSPFFALKPLRHVRFKITAGEKCTSLAGLFANCENLQSCEPVDAGRVTDLSSALKNCHKLESIPFTATGGVKNFKGFCECCFSLKSIGDLDTSSAEDLSFAFSACRSLQQIPQLDTS